MVEFGQEDCLKCTFLDLYSFSKTVVIIFNKFVGFSYKITFRKQYSSYLDQ